MKIAGLVAGLAAIGHLHAGFPKLSQSSRSRCFRLVVLVVAVPSRLAAVAAVAGPILRCFEAALAGPILRYFEAAPAALAGPIRLVAVVVGPNRPVAAVPSLQYSAAVVPIRLVVVAGPIRWYSAIRPNLVLLPSLALLLSSS